jgi:hypothetical protein
LADRALAGESLRSLAADLNERAVLTDPARKTTSKPTAQHLVSGVARSA